MAKRGPPKEGLCVIRQWRIQRTWIRTPKIRSDNLDAAQNSSDHVKPGSRIDGSKRGSVSSVNSSVSHSSQEGDHPNLAAGPFRKLSALLPRIRQLATLPRLSSGQEQTFDLRSGHTLPSLADMPDRTRLSPGSDDAESASLNLATSSRRSSAADSEERRWLYPHFNINAMRAQRTRSRSLDQAGQLDMRPGQLTEPSQTRSRPITSRSSLDVTCEQREAPLSWDWRNLLPTVFRRRSDSSLSQSQARKEVLVGNFLIENNQQALAHFSLPQTVFWSEEDLVQAPQDGAQPQPRRRHSMVDFV